MVFFMGYLNLSFLEKETFGKEKTYFLG